MEQCPLGSPPSLCAGEKKYDIISHVVEDAFGTAMAGVCFLDYIFPEVRPQGSVKELAAGPRSQHSCSLSLRTEH